MGNLFAGLKNAHTSERGTFCKPGDYQVRINKVIMKRTRKNLDAFIVEFKVEKSSYENAKASAIRSFGDKPYDLSALEKTLPNKEGTTAAWFQSLGDRDIGFGALKSFAAAITGSDPKDPEFEASVEEFLTKAVEESTLTGTLVPLEVATITTKKGTEFSLHKWGKAISEAS